MFGWLLPMTAVSALALAAAVTACLIGHAAAAAAGLRSEPPIRSSVGDSVGERCYGPCVRTPVTAWWRPL